MKKVILLGLLGVSLCSCSIISRSTAGEDEKINKSNEEEKLRLIKEKKIIISELDKQIASNSTELNSLTSEFQKLQKKETELKGNIAALTKKVEDCTSEKINIEAVRRRMLGLSEAVKLLEKKNSDLKQIKTDLEEENKTDISKKLEITDPATNKPIEFKKSSSLNELSSKMSNISINPP